MIHRDNDIDKLLTEDDEEIRIGQSTYTIFLDNGNYLTISSDDDSKTINKPYDDLKVKSLLQSLRGN